MTEYSYCKRDLLRYPEKYQMSTYGGVMFLNAYLDSRHDVLKKIDVAPGENLEKFVIENFVASEISTDVIHTDKLLSNTLIKVIRGIDKQSDRVLDIFLKKFEVKRKIFTIYDTQYKENTEDFSDLKNYILLSTNFILEYQHTMNLKYLNACLKLNDLIISILPEIRDERFKKLFSLILQAELACVDNLRLKKGIQ